MQKEKIKPNVSLTNTIHHSFPDLIYACNWFAHGSHVGMVDWICRDQNLRSLGGETV